MRRPDAPPALRFRRAAWFLPVVFALHEAEEWNILAWYRQHYSDLPGTSDSAVRLGLVAYVVVGLVWTVLAIRLPTPRAAAFTLLPLCLLLLANAVQHVYWTVHFAAYGPGVFTAVTLLVPITVILVWRALCEHLVPRWYVVVLALLNVPTVVKTFSGDSMVRFQLRMVNDAGTALASLF